MLFKLRLASKMSNKQIQKAGNDSNQVQAEVVNQYFGLSEERVAQIVDERCAQVLSTCVLESRLVAEQRIGDFKTEMFSVFAKNPELIDALKEPSCVDSLERAARTAAKSSELRDKKLLSELLGKRFEEPRNRHIATGVNRAIEIVDLLTDEELAGLTAYFAVSQYSPIAYSINEGLAILDTLFGKLPICNLPQGEDWIDNLDIHDALRVSQFSTLKKLSDYYFETLEGYTVWGLEKDSEQLSEATCLATNAGIPPDIFIEHELHEGYLRLRVCNRSQINELTISRVINGARVDVPFSDEQLAATSSLFDMTKDAEHEQDMKSMFKDKLREYPNIATVMDWWDSIPSAPRITVVGKALAQANAIRIDPTLPELEYD